MSAKKSPTRNKLPVTVMVWCNGMTHQITLSKDGVLIFHNHDKRDLEREVCLLALSGEDQGCAGVLRTWRAIFSRDRDSTDRLDKLPDRLRGAVSKLLKKRSERQSLKPDDPLTLTPRERIERGVGRIIHDAILECNYRRSRSHWAGGKHNVIVKFGRPYIRGDSSTAWSRNGKWRGTNSSITVRVNAVHWYMRVYKKGLTIVDGCFVLAHLGGDRYLVGRQSRGFDVKPWEARIALGGDGEPRIVKWIRPAEIVWDENEGPYAK